MPNFAKLDYHAPEVTEVMVIAEGDPIPEGYIPAPDEVAAGWTYSSGHWGSPPEADPPADEGVQSQKAAKAAAWGEQEQEENHGKKHKKDR